MKKHSLPRHIAIIMDGNGRWAEEHQLPRISGHKAGMESAREMVKLCAEKGVEVLSLFAFSSENWQRPREEVNLLMMLLTECLQTEVAILHERNVRLLFIGDRTGLSTMLQQRMDSAERLTANNTGMRLVLAINYGGCWDIVNATRKLANKVAAKQLSVDAIDVDLFRRALCLPDLPEPDLFIRPSGEQRLSNFFLWQLAYTELYFISTYWPDFRAEALQLALDFYAKRQRRFGMTSDQMADQ